MFKYRRRPYDGDRRRGRDDPPVYRSFDSVRRQGYDVLRKVLADDPECFFHHVPRLLDDVFVLESYYDKNEEYREREVADFYFKECGVDRNVQCQTNSFDYDAQEGPPLWHAAQRMSMPQFKYFIELGCDPRAVAARDGTIPLQVAALVASDFVHIDKAEDMKKKKVEKYWGVYQSIVDMLIEAGGSVNDADGRGWTALMHVCSGRMAAKDYVCEVMRRYDKSKDDERLLYRSELLVLEDLLRRGARADLVTSGGESVLSVLAQSGLYKHFKIVVTKCPEVRTLSNVPNLAGDYPIHIAARARNLSILHGLLELGADPEVRDSTGQTAMSIVIQSVPPTGSRFTRAEDQRLLSVFAHHGVDLSSKPEVLRDAILHGYMPLISVAAETGNGIDPKSPAFHQLLFESAASRHDELFEFMLLAAAWPDDVLCDAYLLRASTCEPQSSENFNRVFHRRRVHNPKHFWDRATAYGLGSHAFKSRAQSQTPGPEEEKEWLTVCDALYVEARTWEDHAKLLHCHDDEPLPEEEQAVFVKQIPTSLIDDDGKPKTVPGDRVEAYYLHRLACFHRIFGFFHPAFLAQYHSVSKTMKDPRQVRGGGGGEFSVPSSTGHSGIDPDVRWLNSPAQYGEKVRMSMHEMQMGLQTQFSAADHVYLQGSVEFFAENFTYFLTNRIFDHPINLRLLVRWYGHVINCLPREHMLQARIVTRLCFLLQRLGSFCHRGSDTPQRPVLANATGWHAYSHRPLHETSAMVRSYIPDAYSDMLVLASEVARIYRPNRCYKTTVFHELLKEPERPRSQSYYERSRPTINKEDLRDRMPIFEALLRGGYDLSTRNGDGVTVIGRALEAHANLIMSDEPDDAVDFALWREIFHLFQVCGNGIHWDMPFDYAVTIKDRMVSQVPDMELVVPHGRSYSAAKGMVPRLQDLAAKTILKLHVGVRQYLPPRMLQLVDLHRPPPHPAGLPIWRFKDKCHEPRNEDFNRKRESYNHMWD